MNTHTTAHHSAIAAALVACVLTITMPDVNAQIVKSFLPSQLTTVIVGDRYIIESLMEKAKEGQNREVLNNVKFKKITLD